MENLEDFRYYFADEEEIDAFVVVIWKPEATTPREPEGEPDAAPEMKVDCRQQAPPHRLRHMESQDPAPPGHNHKEKEASRHRPLHIRG